MSSSSYCQGLQSCLEPSRLVEPLVLRLKLAPSKSNISRSSTARNPIVADSDCDDKEGNSGDIGGWSFIQSITSNTSQGTKETNETENVYVPPNVNRSSSMLSERSLDMCTESLGSETGSDISEGGDEMALISSNTTYYQNQERSKLRGTRRMNRRASFPPPLSSIRGSTNVQMRPCREGGRLILRAVTVSSCHAYFHEERRNGRLRLHLLKDCPSNSDDSEKEEEEEEEEGVESEGGEGDEEAEVEMKMENSPRRSSRCKEGESESKALVNWDQFWVAT